MSEKCIELEEDWWPEWVEELFDNEEPNRARSIVGFRWEFLEEPDNENDVEYA